MSRTNAILLTRHKRERKNSSRDGGVEVCYARSEMKFSERILDLPRPVPCLDMTWFLKLRGIKLQPLCRKSFGLISKVARGVWNLSVPFYLMFLAWKTV